MKYCLGGSMIHIWARIIKEDKIIKQTIYTNEATFKEDHFLSYLIDICKELDVETPVLLKNHIHSFMEFNSIKFYKEDFLDTVSFHYLILENIKE
jgi:hypothetical protein